MTDEADKIDTGGSAFPGMDYVAQDNKVNPPGMTLRDYFAGQALVGLTTNTEWIKKYVPQATTVESQMEFVASFAYHLADEMLTERYTKY
jgi:hypothetical protein